MDFNAKIEYEKKLLEAMQQSEWDCKKFLNFLRKIIIFFT